MMSMFIQFNWILCITHMRRIFICISLYSYELCNFCRIMSIVLSKNICFWLIYWLIDWLIDWLQVVYRWFQLATIFTWFGNLFTSFTEYGRFLVRMKRIIRVTPGWHNALCKLRRFLDEFKVEQECTVSRDKQSATTFPFPGWSWISNCSSWTQFSIAWFCDFLF